MIARTTVEITTKELGEFLTCFYIVEQIAQTEGWPTERRWTPGAQDFHSKLLEAEKRLGIHVDPERVHL